MDIQDIICLKPGTKVYLIKSTIIETWHVLGHNPNNPKYFYFWGNGSVSNIKCVYLDSSEREHWEVDYDKAKEEMWQQLVYDIQVINFIYMDGKKSLNFEPKKELLKSL